MENETQNACARVTRVRAIGLTDQFLEDDGMTLGEQIALSLTGVGGDIQMTTIAEYDKDDDYSVDPDSNPRTDYVQLGIQSEASAVIEFGRRADREEREKAKELLAAEQAAKIDPASSVSTPGNQQTN